MADTGPPWSIPYVENADLVKDYPAASLALANAIDSGLDAAGGLVEVKTAIKTDTQSSSITGSANASVAISGLQIVHEVADAANKLIFLINLGVVSMSNERGSFGLALVENSVRLGVGTSVSNRAAVSAGNARHNTNMGGSATAAVAGLSFVFVHTPGAGSKTYDAHIINATDATQTFYVNRTLADSDNNAFVRGASTLTMLEVKV